MQTNIEKLAILVHYIISCVGNMPNFGKTVLWKLMYFSDFDYYEQFEKQLTGETYRKIEHGPAPIHFSNVIEKLKQEGKIREVRTPYHDKTQTRYILVKQPNINKLQKNEILSIRQSILRYCNLNATQISALSHLDTPWKATGEKEVIDYKLVFYREPITSVRDYLDDNNN